MTGLSLPTDRADWRRMGRTVATVLGRPHWLAGALLVSVCILTVFVALNAPTFVRRVVIGGDLSILDRAGAVWSLYPVPWRSMASVRDGLLYLTAAAIGTNLVVLTFHLLEGGVAVRESSGSVGAVVLGTLGAGCAPCGIAIAAGVLSTAGVTAGLAILPLDGAEFLLVALGVTVLSLHWLAEGLRSATVDGCPVDV